MHRNACKGMKLQGTPWTLLLCRRRDARDVRGCVCGGPGNEPVALHAERASVDAGVHRRLRQRAGAGRQRAVSAASASSAWAATQSHLSLFSRHGRHSLCKYMPALSAVAELCMTVLGQQVLHACISAHAFVAQQLSSIADMPWHVLHSMLGSLTRLGAAQLILQVKIPWLPV